ncbi:MAG TPA: VOC family protein [Nocardioides sp.]|jgi:lactoylglutathione lyase|nr:VOC family protein [Nocardioides sp.]
MTFSNPMINVYTADLPAALAFYAGLLGFDETFRAPDPEAPDHIELRLDGVTLALSTAEAARPVHGLEASPGSHGFQLAVWTDDVDTAYDALVAAGAPAYRPPRDTGNDNRSAVVRDPDGNLVELVAKRA